MKHVTCFVLCLALLALAGCGSSGGGGGGGSSQVVGYNDMVVGQGGEIVSYAPYDALAAIDNPEDVSPLAAVAADNINVSNDEPPAGPFMVLLAEPATEKSLYRDVEDDGTLLAEVLKTEAGFKLVLTDDYEQDQGIKGYELEWVEFKELNSAAEYEELVDASVSGRFQGRYNVSARAVVTEGLDFTDEDNGKHYQGTFTTMHLLFLGGEKLGLSYSDFGAWAAYDFLDGSIDGVPTKGQEYEEVAGRFAYGAEDKKAAFSAGAGTRTFSGSALASAYSHDYDINTVVFGDANLSVDLADLNNTQLELDFKDFYTFSISGLGVDGNGRLGDTSNTAVAVSGSNNTGNGLDLSGSSFNQANLDTKTTLDGQFYGATATDPSEATGVFKLRGDNGERVSGSFGVKK